MMLGTKINNLQIMKNNGINIPDFYIIKHSDVLNEKIEVSKISDIKELSLNLKKQVKEKYKLNIKLENKFKKYAVRSSANLEDNSESSFAGQFDTYLNIPFNELEENILKCFLSLYNVNVIEYMLKNNFDINSLKMNVIIEEMIDADISGVLFTSNPQGLLNETVISVAKGLGENVVANKGIVTNYYYNCTDDIYYYDGINDLLTSKQIKELILLSNQIKKLFGDYLDIEFAIKDNKIYILQARNITTIDQSHILILDNSNIVESYPNLSLPLTISFVNDIYSNVFKGVSSRVLKNDRVLNKYEHVFKNMVGSVNGRIYYKISNWYTLIKFLPFNKRIIPIWQEMLGVKNKNYNQDKVNLSLKTRFLTYIHTFNEMRLVPRNMKKLNNKFISINDHFYKQYNDEISAKEVINLYKDIEEQLVSCWDITLLNDMYAFIYTGMLKNKLKHKYKNDSIVNNYISDITNIESLKPIQELINIAYEDHFLNNNELEKRKKNYIKVYGDRSLEELKLESQTFRTNKKLLDDKIKEYQQDQEKLKILYNNINKKKEKNKEKNIIIKWLTNKATLGIKNREISRLNRSRIFGMVRTMFLRLGEIFTDNNIIDSKDDIFYLTIDEVFDLIDNKKSMKDIISKRKLDYEMYAKLPSYSRLIFMNEEFNKTLKDPHYECQLMNNNILVGTPCSNGIVTGEVLVINDINNIKNVKDKILVTKMTDPGWVFLLAQAKGIISEKGSLLSHTAIIARELKVPFVVGVNNLLNTLKDGDIVLLDGTTGRIEIKK